VLRTSFIYSVVKVGREAEPARATRKQPEVQTDRAGRVGQERFELSTPRLSSVCSNQLSYWPVGLIGLSRPNSKPCHQASRANPEDLAFESIVSCSISPKAFEIDRNRLGRSRGHDSRKEVIQPQVPLRLPCYDFTPVTSHSLGGCLRGWRTDF
jgi:hypothetical protein